MPTLLARYLDEICRHPELGPEVVHREDIPPRPARFGALPPLAPEARRGLSALGIQRLYAHQEEAVSLALAGRDVVVVTPTASGKTLCYNLPVIHRCLEEPSSRALYLFPMKALEQDQLASFNELAGASGVADRVTARIYDGDTSPHHRAGIRAAPPNVVITNPDMLHQGILAHHQGWEAFFSNLRHLVLDEVHAYRGVFGSHVAHVLRRLLRVAALYGSTPRVVACSATIANPGEHASRLLGREVPVVDASGAPEAARHFLFVNPRRLSASTVATRLLAGAVRHDLATIVFTKSRKMTELIYAWTVQGEPDLARVISAYRAGYLPEERREIEKALFGGSLKGVVSTSALEMGIDIGALDVCVLVGYPGAVTTTWQRGGRVGRQDRDSLIVLVAQQDALDQYFMKHPRVFFDSGFEPAVIDPGNRPIMKDHLVCAAAETPLTTRDPWFEDGGEEAVEELAREGRLLRAADGSGWHSLRRRPQREVNIRGIGESFTIMEEPGPAGEEGGRPRVIGSLDGIRAFSEGHPGAVYLHRASQYQVTRMDLEGKNIFARKVSAGHYTVPLRRKETAVLGIRRSRPVKNFVARLGDLEVTEQVIGYEKKRISGGERLSVHELDLPPSTFETVGLWIEMDDFIPRAVAAAGLNFMGGIHAVEHAAIALFPLFALCERDDVGGISIPLHPQVGKAAVFIYDGYPGGVGLAEQSFARLEELLERTLSVISECECEKGCPACIYSNKCGNGNVPLDKRAAMMVLSLLLGREEVAAPAESPGEGDEPPCVEIREETEEIPEKPAGPLVTVLDVETLRSAAEVGGWHNAHLMGLAVAVTWNSRTGEFASFREDRAEELLHGLARADLVVGFNLLGFDYRVLSAYDDGTLARLATFDILYDVKKRLGFRLSLDHLACHTLGEGKTADGLQSLEWVKQGRLELVEEYCRHDVRITADLFLYGLREKHVRFADREGRLMELAVDWDLARLLEAARKP